MKNLILDILSFIIAFLAVITAYMSKALIYPMMWTMSKLNKDNPTGSFEHLIGVVFLNKKSKTK